MSGDKTDAKHAVSPNPGDLIDATDKHGTTTRMFVESVVHDGVWGFVIPGASQWKIVGVAVDVADVLIPGYRHTRNGQLVEPLTGVEGERIRKDMCQHFERAAEAP